MTILEKSKGPDIHVVGLFSRDAEALARRFKERIGWAPWYIYDHEPWDCTYRGESASFTMREACVTLPNGTQLAILQPLRGKSLYDEIMEERGEGLGFLTIWSPTVEGERAARERLGEEVLLSGRVGESVHFYFVDTEPVLTVVLETSTTVPGKVKPDRTIA
jgi:methylmalonyl-CoA/ethylmalonyl-CoA epimerase